MKWYVNACVLVGIAAAGLGCGGSATDKATEVAIEQAAKADGLNVDVKVDSEKGTVQMRQTSEDGKTSAVFGEGSKLPADFPKDVPVYEGLALMMAQSTPSEGVFMLSGTVVAPLDKVAAFYKEKTAAQGWKVETTMSVPGQSDMVVFSKEGRMLSVTLGVEGDKTAIVLSVAKS